jgi:hypothetical protein
VEPVSRLPQLIPTIPEPVRIVLRNAVWAYGRATAGARPLPDFLILGAQKAGTTALYDYLHRHPAISGPSWKEVSFFDRHWARGERWYRGHFPREQLLVLFTEELAASTAETYAGVLRFLGAPPHELDAYPRVFSRDYEQMRPETRAELDAFYAAPNRRLSELLGRDLDWA